MKPNYLPACAIALMLLSFPLPPARSQGADISLRRVAFSDGEAVTAGCRAVLERWKAPGGAVTILRDGALLYSEGFGTRDNKGAPYLATTLNRIGSCSKSFAGLSTLKAIELFPDKLSRETKVGDILGFDRSELVDPRVGDITVEDLLCQVSGFDNTQSWGFDPAIDLGMVAQKLGKRLPVTQADCITVMLKQARLASAPGAKYLYCNANFTLAACVVTKVTGIPYGEFLAKYITGPAGSDVRIGGNFLADRLPDETMYFDGPLESGNFWSQFEQGKPINGLSYGAGDLSICAGSGGLAGSSQGLARFLWAVTRQRSPLMSRKSQSLLLGKERYFAGLQVGRDNVGHGGRYHAATASMSAVQIGGHTYVIAATCNGGNLGPGNDSPAYEMLSAAQKVLRQ